MRRRLAGAIRPRNCIGSALLMAIALAVAGPAAAQEVEVLANFGNWTAYKFTENGNPVCYMASRPTSEKGDYTRRGEVFAMVTHRPAEEKYDVVGFIAGYTFRDGSEVTAVIDRRKTYKLFTHADTAWLENGSRDTAMVKDMIRGADMVVQGTSSRGTLTTDTYSLTGFTKTHNVINEACNR